MFQKVAKIAIMVVWPLFFSCSPDSKIPAIDNGHISRLWDADGVVNISIAHLRNLYEGAPTKIVGEYRLSGTVVSRDREGSFYKTLVLDDGTGGVEVKMDMEEIFKRFKIHSRVLVRCNGLWIDSFGGALQLGAEPYQGGETHYIAASQIASHLQNDDKFYGEVLPFELGLGDLSPHYISRYVVFEGVRFADEESGRGWADTGEGAEYYSDRYLVDDAGRRLAVRTSRYASFALRALPRGRGCIEGVLGYSGGRYYLTVSAHTDFIA